MKIVSIADVHGNKIPLHILEKFIKDNSVDLIIVHGDYVDSHDDNNEWPQQKEIFDKLIEYKKLYPTKIKLLIGNHDMAYLLDSHTNCCQYKYAKEIKQYLLNNLDLFDILYIHDKTIFVHAGVTQYWLDTVGLKLEELNDKFHDKKFNYFRKCSIDRQGDSEEECCTWIRPNSLILYGLKGYNQIIGHTMLESTNSNRILMAKDLLKNTVPLNIKNYYNNATEKYVLLDSPSHDWYSIYDNGNIEVYRYNE